MNSLLGITPLRYWWIRRRFGVRDGTPEQIVRAKLGSPAATERSDDGQWWKYLVHHAQEYDISYSILMNAGVVATSVWGSSLRRTRSAK